jgi:hypothetical protein
MHVGSRSRLCGVEPTGIDLIRVVNVRVKVLASSLEHGRLGYKQYPNLVRSKSNLQSTLSRSRSIHPILQIVQVQTFWICVQHSKQFQKHMSG